MVKKNDIVAVSIPELFVSHTPFIKAFLISITIDEALEIFERDGAVKLTYQGEPMVIVAGRRGKTDASSDLSLAYSKDCKIRDIRFESQFKRISGLQSPTGLLLLAWYVALFANLHGAPAVAASSYMHPLKHLILAETKEVSVEDKTYFAGLAAAKFNVANSVNVFSDSSGFESTPGYYHRVSDEAGDALQKLRDVSDGLFILTYGPEYKYLATLLVCDETENDNDLIGIHSSILATAEGVKFSDYHPDGNEEDLMSWYVTIASIAAPTGDDPVFIADSMELLKALEQVI